MKRLSLLFSVLALVLSFVFLPASFVTKAHAAEASAEASKVEAEEEGKDKKESSPYKMMAAAVAMGCCAFATAITQMKIGTAAMGTIAEKPEVAPMCIVLLAIPETIVILGFVIGAMILMF